MPIYNPSPESNPKRTRSQTPTPPRDGRWDFEIYEDPVLDPVPERIEGPRTPPPRRHVRFEDPPGTDTVTEEASHISPRTPRTPRGSWRPPSPPVLHGGRAAVAARAALARASASPGRVALLPGAWQVVVSISRPQTPPPPGSEQSMDPSSSSSSPEAQANSTSTSTSTHTGVSGAQSAGASGPEPEPPTSS